MYDISTGKQYVYRLKDPSNGLYFKDIQIVVEDSSQSRIMLSPDATMLFKSPEELSRLFYKIDQARKTVEHLNTLNLSEVDTNSKHKYIKEKREKLQEIIKTFDSLEMEILEVKTADEPTLKVFNDIISSVNDVRTEHLFEHDFALIIESKEKTRTFKEFYEVFKQWKCLDNSDSYTHIIFGGKPHKDSYINKISINLSNLEDILKSLGLKYFLFENPPHCGFAALNSDDFNFLRLSHPDSIVSYVEIAKAIELREQIRSSLNLPVK